VAVVANEASNRFELQLLPGFAVYAGTLRLDLPVGVERLLAYVAVHQAAVSRSQAAAALWPDRDLARSTGNLRTTLWRLRQAAPALLTVTATHMSLSPRVTVDATEARAAAGRIRNGELPGPDLAEVSRLTADLLADWPDEWLTGWRERWRMVRLAAMETAATGLTAAGRTGDAIDLALAVIQADPLRESAHRALIEAQLAAGNRAGAMHAYERLTHLLDRELGIAPAAELGRTLTRGLSGRAGPVLAG
jgi:DNA-binding SARP family transcriptional activator